MGAPLRVGQPYVPGGSWRVMHLNTRGLNIPAKRERLLEVATAQGADIAVLTET